MRKHVYIFLLLIIITVFTGCSGNIVQSYLKDELTEQASGIVALAQEPVDKSTISELKNEKITDENTLKHLKDNWTIACFGLDSRDEDSLVDSNSDVIMLMVLDKDTGEIKMMSVYRDTCLRIDDKYRKANYAYVTGGPLKTITMLNENLDLEIDDYVAFNWKAVATGIDMLGGVRINITEEEMKAINSGIPETSKVTGISTALLDDYGHVTLDGVQAVAYCRIRKIDDDFMRTERQRKVITAALAKAKQTNPLTLKKALKTVIPMIGTSIDDDDIDLIMDNITRIKLVDASGFPFEKYTKIAHKADYVFADGFSDNVKTLHKILYNDIAYEPSETVLEIEKGIQRYSR